MTELGPNAGPPPMPAPLPPVVRKSFFARHKILTVVGGAVAVVVVIGIIGAIAGGGSAKDPATGTPPAASGTVDQPTEPAEETPGLNTPIVVGDFEITVTGVDAGVTSVGEGITTVSADGQFAVVHVRVKNLATNSRLLSSMNQRIADTEGRQFDSDPIATANVPGNTAAYFSDIEPGFVVEGVWVFDMAPESIPGTLLVKDSVTASRATHINLS